MPDLSVEFDYSLNDKRIIGKVKSNGVYYEMPFAYTIKLKRFLKNLEVHVEDPIANWYNNLTDREKQIVIKQ